MPFVPVRYVDLMVLIGTIDFIRPYYIENKSQN